MRGCPVGVMLTFHLLWPSRFIAQEGLVVGDMRPLPPPAADAPEHVTEDVAPPVADAPEHAPEDVPPVCFTCLLFKNISVQAKS